MKRFLLAILLTGLLTANAASVMAQEDSKLQPMPSEEQQEKEKAEREKQAFLLLDQMIADAQMLKLPDNRIRLQIQAADLLWDRNSDRARSLFAQAADGVAELQRNADPNERRRGSLSQASVNVQLRQSLVLTAAQHDAQLAYQLLASTRLVAPPAQDGRNAFRPGPEENLEQTLLARIAALDPSLALQNAERLLDKGQFPRTLGSVLAQLQAKDKEGAAKLESKLLKGLQSANMVSNVEATSLALTLLLPGPRPPDTPGSGSPQAQTNQQSVLGQSGYVDLMGAVIDSALNVTPQLNTNQRANNPRARVIAGSGGAVAQSNTNAPTDAQIEQVNARRILGGLQALLPQIDQYLPARSSAVRQKMTDFGIGNDQRVSMNEVFTLMKQGTADSLLQAAATLPPAVQSRIYQQAAIKALEEGNPDRARQIATDHLETRSRDQVLQQIEFRQIAEKADTSKTNELRQKLASLSSDSERVDLLLQLSTYVKEKNRKLALQLLEEARQLTARRATSYRQFDEQLRVAEAFEQLEPGRGFETLEPGIAQLNELLSAAATLSGFEVNIFRDGELPLDTGSALSGVLARYGQTLGTLARDDFERAQALVNRFQLTETRIIARLSIVKGLLGLSQTSIGGNSNFNFTFGMRTGRN